MMASCSACAEPARAMSGCAFIRSDPFPACALRTVLDHDAFRSERVTDAVAGGEIAALACFGAFGEQAFDPSGIDAVRGALEPGFRVVLQQAKELAGAEQCCFCRFLVLWICGF